uniref:Uncharacterized protein n=1 Tax=Avena sativa TaxID=4498 RepID=A0ACD5X8Z2_AVESA
MDGEAPAAASVAAVLGDDDLLREILIRLGFPNYLVRAALVSKWWLLHASDPAFLSRFRDRHPPRLLGFFAGYPSHYRFVPLPQPPELAALSRRAVSSFDDAYSFALNDTEIKHCRNGRLITMFGYSGRHSLLSPLLAGEPAAVVPLVPRPLLVGTVERFTEIFLPEDGGRDAITWVDLWRVGQKVSAEVYVLGPGGWGVPATVTTDLGFPYPTTFFHKMLPPVHGKVFMVTSIGYILGLDLATASFFALELPVGVGNNTYMLSCAEDSGIYLVSTDGFQLNVWLHRMTGHDGGAGGWLPVDTFCVREACARLAGHNWVSRDGDYIDVTAVGDNAEFVFLDHRASGIVLYVHLRSRVVEKVFDRQLDSDYIPLSSSQIFPLMMIWPPIFPALSG